jgi:hypothetical protein
VARDAKFLPFKRFKTSWLKTIFGFTNKIITFANNKVWIPYPIFSKDTKIEKWRRPIGLKATIWFTKKLNNSNLPI